MEFYTNLLTLNTIVMLLLFADYIAYVTAYVLINISPPCLIFNYLYCYYHMMCSLNASTTTAKSVAATALYIVYSVPNTWYNVYSAGA